MDTKRIASAMDLDRLASAHVCIVGVGGSLELILWLARCGVGTISFFDFDTVGPENLVRQGFVRDEIGMAKVEAAAGRIYQVNPKVVVYPHTENFLNLPDDSLQAAFGGMDVLVAATDSFAAQARVNQVALLTGIPAVWLGLTREAMSGEVIFWHKELDSCYRCLVARRYIAQANAKKTDKKLDPPSNGVTVLDMAHVDSIAGQIILGLLTRGADNRFGRLIDQLGDRSYLKIGLRPDYRHEGRDVIREQLGIAEDNDRLFAWNCVALRDPDGGDLPCFDCEKYRGHTFIHDPNEKNSVSVRVRESNSHPIRISTEDYQHRESRQ